MEVQNIALWDLRKDVSPMLTSVVEEVLRPLGMPGMMNSPALLEKVPAGHAADPTREVDGRREHND